MVQAKRLSLTSVLVLTAVGMVVVWQAWAANDRVQFPENYKDGVHYATVNRGGIREEIFANLEAITAAEAGQPMPNGTVIMMEDYRGGQLHRYVVMEKQAGWGSAHPENIRAGDWEFREFAPDRSPNMTENGQRCMSCHQSQVDQDFIFTIDQMKRAD
ncbi:cytochrome P460 family protein [Ochrobactrum sp. Q0168]|uniref:cytochrome P460 family protein n=1 Tax=Ochrobactrum sp. Q0168 TaxID=2793241 RepID=UPI0018EA99C6|nr:cytochrome P460 family protein [Ochrobactrum sp. Q0168]